MRPFIVLLAAGFIATAAHGSELTSTDPNPSRKTTVPMEKYLRPPHDDMRVSLDVLIDGKPARVISHNGKLYLPAPRLGCEYQIRVDNRGSHRVAAIVSVDGLSVIKGDAASERSPGYLVDARGDLVIKGWQRDRDTVAAFTFEDRKSSYAYGRGYRDNIGVINLLAIEEQLYSPRLESDFHRVAPLSKLHDGSLGGTGTGWGRAIDSGVTYVPFVRGANRRTVTIYYDTADNLRRIGVPVDGPYPKPLPIDTEFRPPPMKGIR